MITVWIAARLPLIREGLRALLAPARDLFVTAPAPATAAALARDAAFDPPDALLLDVDLLEQEGWGLLTDLASATPRTALIVVAETVDDRRVGQALELGARGYLLRDASADEMSAAVRAAAHGLVVLHAGAARSIQQRHESEQPRELDDVIEPLSARELEVLRLMARGHSNKQIAVELIITEHTVKFHIRAILGKLGAANRTEAVMLAIQKGLVAI